MDKYFTKNNKEITHLVSKGKTEIILGIGIKALRRAQKIAKQKNTYPYEIYNLNKEGKKQVAGFGIPN